MTLKRISDFRSRPAWWEYCLVYFGLSGSTLILGMAYSETVNPFWAWVALIVMTLTIAAFSAVRHLRKRRSLAFFHEWLNNFDDQQLASLKVRFSNSRIESQLIDLVIESRNGSES